jgi:hypothetical protein
MERTQRLAARVAAMTVVVLVAAGCGATPRPTDVAAAESATPTVLETPTAVPAPTPAATPTPVSTGLTIGWAPVLASASAGKVAADLGGGISAAVAFGDGFVLAGSENQGQHAVVWYSPDGTHWQAIDNAPGFADGVIDSLVRLPDGLLAVGTSQGLDSQCAGGALGCNPVSPIRLWTSPDGLTWHLLPGTATAPFGRAQLELAVDGPSGLVAFGELVPAQGTNITSMIWTSDDGRSWTRAPQFSTAFPTDSMSDLEGGPGGYVAVGSGWADGNPTLPQLAWYSSDGKSWKLGSGPGDQGPTIVLACAGGFLGVANPLAQASFWTTADGVNWTVQPAVVGRPNWPSYVGTGLFSDGKGILALGSDSFQTPGAWITTDGRDWQSVAMIGVQPPFDSAVAGSVVGALGSKGVIVTTETQPATGGSIWTLWLGTIAE